MHEEMEEYRMLQWTKLGMVSKSVGEAFIVNVGMMELRFIVLLLLLLLLVVIHRCFVVRWLRHLRDGLWFRRSISVRHDGLGRVVERSYVYDVADSLLRDGAGSFWVFCLECCCSTRLLVTARKNKLDLVTQDSNLRN
jgi:hypothetical protein